MRIQQFKHFLQKYTPNFIEYIFIIKNFYLHFFKIWKNFIFEWKQVSLFRKVIGNSSMGLTYEMVVESTFNECYTLLKGVNIIFLTQIKKGCYRFIILEKDIDSLYPLLVELMKLGYLIELSINEENRIVFSQYYSFKNLKKYLYKFILLRIYKVYGNSNTIEEFGSEVSFELEHWYENNSYYITGSKNNIQNKLSYHSLNLTTPVKIFNHRVQQINELLIRDEYLEKSAVKNIDIVYTWVDSSDKEWFQKKERYKNLNTEEIHDSSISSNRFANRDELKYSLRSIEKYLSGYKRIFIVVDGQKPIWLKESKELIVVNHKDLFPDKNILPVFNSHAIETVLHRIKGLSEHYLYINDDIIFGRAVDISLFFPKKGILSIFPSTSTYIPFGNINNKTLPVDTAAINTRELLLQENLGFAVYKFKHTPLPQLKSLLFELEEMFAEKVLLTRENRFRNPQDISMTSSLLYNFSYFKNIIIKTKINYAYINLGLKNYLFILKKITTASTYKRPDVFCVNDVDSDSLKNTTENFIAIMENFLPESSRYEKKLEQDRKIK